MSKPNNAILPTEAIEEFGVIYEKNCGMKLEPNEVEKRATDFIKLFVYLQSESSVEKLRSTD